MHIAFLSPEYPHPLCDQSAGIGTSIKNNAEALVKRGIKVSILLYQQKVEETITNPGLTIYFIKNKSYPIGGWYFYRQFLNEKINQLINEENIDVLEVPDWTGITAFMKIDCSVIMRLHGSDGYFCYMEGRKQKLKNRFLEKKAFKNADAIISVSNYTGDKTNRIFNLNRKYTVIPNSLNLEDFCIKKNNSSKENIILYFGAVIRKKGVLELASIFNKVIKTNPAVQLVLAGRDVIDILDKRSTLEMFMERLTKKAREKVVYLKAMPYDEIKNEIKKATVVVLPSFAEALPMTWIEAMAFNKALVTSDIGWSREVMINNETGFTVNPEKHQLYADKILKLLEDPDLRIKMGSNARRRVENKFSSDTVTEQNIEIYQKYITRK